MTLSALENLDSDWQAWLNTNLDNQVPADQLAVKLFEEGMVDAAIELIKSKKTAANKPYIDTRKNNIALTDKDVSILLTHENPKIAVIENFLSTDEATRLIQYSEAQFAKQSDEQQLLNKQEIKQASNQQPAVDGKDVAHTTETDVRSIELLEKHKLLLTIEDRIAELCNWQPNLVDSVDVASSADIGSVEDLQVNSLETEPMPQPIKVLQCDKRAKYRLHTELLQPQDLDEAADTNKVQCLGMLLLLLSAANDDGGTVFPAIKMKLRLKAGTAIYFSGFDIDEEVDLDQQALSIKDNSPVTSGVRYLAVKYFYG